jgi:UDP-N-acetylglucosamine 4,6-dehydratase
MFTVKTILITGGTGSFGKSFTKWLLKNDNPKKLIIFSRDWLKQKQMREELGDPENIRWFIGDVRDVERLGRALYGVDLVVHAAAIKDVDACTYNPSEALQTNVMGSQNVIDACIYNNVDKAILISTDKAVNPTNTYGKTKALAESLFIDEWCYAANHKSKFAVCRYGNVWGSAGSVVPKYKHLVAEGAESLPVTDERMTRYFFPMNSAIQLVYESFKKMKGREIFIPKMKAAYITDLVKAFDKDYHIIGMLSGEKLHETLYVDEHETSETAEKFTVEELKQMIEGEG